MQWDFRNLIQYDDIAFEYNASGLRTSKTQGNTRTDYIWAGDKLLREQTAINTLDFIYGPDGVLGFNLNNTPYWYSKNIFGDVESIFDDLGNLIAEYEYDALGNHGITVDVNGIGTLNPFRYRSYYFDTSTGLYYLKSRWYDSETGRFVSADAVEILDVSKDYINGLNLYAYCFNNFVMMTDENGNLPKWLKRTLLVIAAVAVVVAVAAAVAVTAGAAAVAIAGAVGVAGATVGTTVATVALATGVVVGSLEIVHQISAKGIDNMNFGSIAISTFGGSAIGALGAAIPFAAGSAGGLALLIGGRAIASGLATVWYGVNEGYTDNQLLNATLINVALSTLFGTGSALFVPKRAYMPIIASAISQLFKIIKKAMNK